MTAYKRFFHRILPYILYIPLIALTCAVAGLLLYFTSFDLRPLSLSLFTFPFSLPIFFYQKRLLTFFIAGFVDGVLKTILFLVGIQPFRPTIAFLATYLGASILACLGLLLCKGKHHSFDDKNQRVGQKSVIR